MKKIILVILVSILIITSILVTINLTNKSYEEKYSSSQFCYVSAWGQIGGIGGGKVCECDGELIQSKCPKGAVCDGYETRCYGKITNYHYIFNNTKFNTSKELENYCINLEKDKKEACLRILNS